MPTFDDDTLSTENDGLLDQLRAEGILGPFDVADWAGDTDIGLRRSVNEDRWGHVGTRLFVIADGVGGNAGGDLAAETAATVSLDTAEPVTEAGARRAVARANTAVRYAGELAGLEGLGTTLVVLAVHENHLVVASVGDSRLYRLRDGELEQLTRDHNVRNELAASGLTDEAVQSAGIRLDALTAYIGMATDFDIPANIASFSIMSGDRFLLVTDGVHGQIDHDRLAALAATPSCADGVAAMLHQARDAGGRDNATAILLEFASRTGSSLD